MKRDIFDRWFPFILLALGLLVRMPSILRGDFAFTYDTGRDLLAVRDFIAGNPSLIGPTTGLIGVFYGPWWYWILTPWFLLFGGNPIALTAVIATLGSLAAIVAYQWGASIGGRRFGIILGLILAASPGIVKATNQLWSPSLLVPTTLAVVILMGNLRRLSPWAFVWVGFCLALLAEFEIIYGILFGVGFVIASLLWLRNEFSILKIRNFLAGIAVVELPRFMFEVRHGFIQTKTFLSELGGSAIAFHPKRGYLMYESVSSVLPGTPAVQNILIAIVIVILFIYWKRISGKLRQLVLVAASIIAVFWITPFFYSKDFWNYYLLGLPVLYGVIIAAMGSALPRKFFAFEILAFILYFFFLFQPGRIISSLMSPHFVGDAAVFRNQREILDFVASQTPAPFKYIAYNPAQHDYTWQYLFWWYEKRGMLPTFTENNPQVMFVIIEPDDSYPDRLKTWLKIRDRDGVVLREITFPSGIIVQIRRLRWN